MTNSLARSAKRAQSDLMPLTAQVSVGAKQERQTLRQNPYFSPFFHTTGSELSESRFNKAHYQHLAESLLDTFYPVTCACGQKMTGRIATRPYVIRCTECHLTASRLSDTPFVHLKLPLWMLGWAIEQSAVKYPQVLTGAEIKRQLSITEEAALRLKKRVQVFASQQKNTVEDLFFSELQKRFKGKSLLEPDTADINKRVDTPVLGLPIPQSDSVVLFSARERSNKGRKRFRHHGQTASIYASDSLGGRQIGTMVQTTTWKGGPALYESIPNQQIRTLLPIISKQIPKDIPFFTDMGMDWYRAHNKNHRTVNHNLPSKRGTGKSRRRFQQNGIHTQAAEGRQGALKTAFRSYRYVRPEYSQLYLNEYSFFGALKYFGVERIAAKVAQPAQIPAKPSEVSGWGMSGMNSNIHNLSRRHPASLRSALSFSTSMACPSRF
jgi:ISXO2-like transposase domain